MLHFHRYCYPRCPFHTCQAQTRHNPIPPACGPSRKQIRLDRHRHALYFSRVPVPWDRDHFSFEQRPRGIVAGYNRHIGIYAYSVNFLRRYKDWSTSDLEQTESLEQLRILWQGERILVVLVETAPEAGVDTQDDRDPTVLERD